MQTSKKFYWIAQFSGWVTYGLFILLATYTYAPSKVNFTYIFSATLFILNGVLMTHLMRGLFIKLNFLEMKLAPLIPRLFFMSIAVAIVMSLFNSFISHYIEKDYSRPLSLLSSITEIFQLTVLTTLWNAIYFTYHFFSKSINQEISMLHMQASKNEIELKSLREQINPHFLFNALNSVRALISIAPEDAKNGVTKLSNLLRNSLIHGKHNEISIKDEINLIENYLDIEKIRFEERLTIIWDIAKDTEKERIPPFLIYTQVENAIKHGISKLQQGGEIYIQTNLAQNKLHITVKNSGKITSDKSDTAIGIQNTKRRLQIQYNQKATFHLKEENDYVICEIIIDKN